MWREESSGKVQLQEVTRLTCRSPPLRLITISFLMTWRTRLVRVRGEIETVCKEGIVVRKSTLAELTFLRGPLPFEQFDLQLHTR